MVIGQRIMADGGRQKIAGYEFGTLMNQLIKSMLAVCAGLTPDDGAGLMLNRLSASIHRLAIAFHITLLQVSRETVQALIIGQNSI